MDNQKALNILVQAVKMAQLKGGVFTLEDARVIAEAVDVFVKPAEPQTEEKKEEEVIQEVEAETV